MTDHAELKLLAQTLVEKLAVKEANWSVESEEAWLAAHNAFYNVFAPGDVLKLMADLEGYQQGAKAEADAADEARGELRKIKAENEALRKDSERYRWLRSQPNDCSAPRIDICVWVCNGDDSVNEGEGLRLNEADAAIDAAMSKEG